ncbi:D-alanyl-D-alanine carboxypeptidase family protein [Cellulomonas fimi]|uniref:D-alanyl-D-alanine carboxypeptidase family protein n=1 Tax=Cellulomonas fimi TaxID=1708 RepID=UPI00234CA133|nr:D-alanyl-D-alanine carboxypeptidase family protein [Cellulomonas fimi]MDC7123545.1 D-alanyl-D-alanine carboxypeptidase family protein [Cellulomonas fimi]
MTSAPQHVGPALPSWSQPRPDGGSAQAAPRPTYGAAASTRTSPAGGAPRTTLPAPGARTTLPAPGARTSLPAPGGRTALPAPGGRTTPPAQGALAAGTARPHVAAEPAANRGPAWTSPAARPHEQQGRTTPATPSSSVPAADPAARTTAPASAPSVPGSRAFAAAPAAPRPPVGQPQAPTAERAPHATEPGATAAHPRPAPVPAWSAAVPAPRSAVETTVMAPLPLDDEAETEGAVHAASERPVTSPARERERSATRSRTASTPPADRHQARMPRLAVRLGVLGALAGVTVVIPTVSQGALEGVGVPGSDARAAQESLPDTVSALTASSLSILPPSSLVSADGALAAREVAGASRTEVRSALPGCDGTDRPAGENGLLRTADLCTLWDGHTQLRADAAVSLAEFNQAFVARFGGDLCLSSGYRSLAQQRAVKAQKGGLAAAPGKSNHGWGLAIDLCQNQTSGAKWAWILDNGPAFGWENPAWAKRGGSGPFEPWHWEYAKGVQEDGEYYGR